MYDTGTVAVRKRYQTVTTVRYLTRTLILTRYRVHGTKLKATLQSKA